MEGLEASVISLSNVEHDNGKTRIDSGYFSKIAIVAERRIEALPNRKLGEISSTFRKGIFDIKADTYVEPHSGVQFLRIGDLRNGLIRKTSTAWIDRLAHETERKTALKYGDLVLSKTAYPAAAFVNIAECNTSQDTIAVRLNAEGKKNFRTGFISSFLNTRHGYALMERRFQGNVQQHLSLEDGKAIRIPLFSIALQERVHALVVDADRKGNDVAFFQQKAEETLFAALGLENWTPQEPLSYTACASDSLAAGRWDAQYFRPLFDEVEQRLTVTGRAVKLGKILDINSRGRQPKYTEEGLSVVNSKHVRTNKVMIDDENRMAMEADSPVVIEKGDVLLNGTGVGTIGRAAAYLHDQRALPDNHVTVLRSDRVDPIYLAVFLNSQLGQLQIERHIKGSSGQIELYPNDIAKIVFWDAPDHVQTEIREAVLSAFNQERRAKELLEAAKRAVEIAIEDGEATALAFLGAAEEAD
ncbi:hypothetical protein [Vreelandella sp. V005]|uniref:hypothetical protein n=1 Tax=Vreelandella sp. V005 TaxID=3459608 RepID=UPI004044A44A